MPRRLKIATSESSPLATTIQLKHCNKMERFRQGTKAERITIAVIALYALLFQALFAASVPAGAFGSQSQILCAQHLATSGTQQNEKHYHCGCCCCISGCTSCGLSALTSAFSNIDFPVPNISLPALIQTQGIARDTWHKLIFSARGPPQVG